MAVLSIDTLTGCSSIPSFLGGTSDTPANPSITIFHNTTAPTNWTKNTSASINDIALRVIGGAEGVGVSTGGSLPFTTVFSPKTSPITSTTEVSGASITPNTTGIPSPTLNTVASSVVLDGATLSLAQTPAHTHSYVLFGGAAPATVAVGAIPAGGAASTPFTSGSGGGPGGHSHTSPIGPHAHPISDPGHTHPLNSQGPHSHSFTLSQNFNIDYVDVIIATKD
jgi:hypothetical protein